ncbi:MAG: AsmA family protein, partial [Pseudomonadota bacterium]|nr:AsmA family protein [Pseudomonadota bacterium]
GGLVALLLLGCAVGAGEWLGWPFLAPPLERALSKAWSRRVSLTVPVERAVAPAGRFRIRFVGGVRLQTPGLEIAAPAWSAAPHLLLARDVDLQLRYIDLWRAYRGQPLRIEGLTARALDAQLERLADGRASWQLAAHEPSAEPPKPISIPAFGHLQVTDGLLACRDAALAIDVVARLSLADSELKFNAVGLYRTLPVKIDLLATGVLSVAGGVVPVVPLTVEATVGRAQMSFKGSADDILHLGGFRGRFSVKGPSLAALGDPVGVTLPTTSAFSASGVIVRQDNDWRVRIDDATVGSSRLNGAFSYEAGRAVPLLAGRLGGSRLFLVDLGPVVGTTPAELTVTTPSIGKANRVSGKVKGKVLPARPFDLAALRVMDANVLIDIAEVDLNTTLLEPLRPLRGHLQLSGGVLTLSELDARTADGRLAGRWSLDGRGSQALWDADLRWTGVRLERWIHQARAGSAPPYLSGRLSGRATVKGQGLSTADILASLNGRVRTELSDGAVSHLLVEAAGLDIAQALGVLFKSDDALPLSCAVADLDAVGGVFRPRVMVLDTTDSAVWIDGSLSLATEALDLRAVVIPKDFSPLTLRSPLRVGGSLAVPEVSLEKEPIARKVAASILLALLNPLAALIPLIDPGDADLARRTGAGCRKLMQRGAAAKP